MVEALPPGAEELLLVRMARGGDREAFTMLVGRRQQGVRRFLLYLCRDRDVADDLAQQAFLRLWTSLGQLRDVDAFNGWFKQILVSVWRDELRRRKIDFVANEDRHESVDPSHHPVPGLRLDLDAALAQLSPQVQLCVVLAYNEGHSHGDIAELLQLPLGTVKSHVTRGAARLKQLLEVYRE
jgi:RNA polymerase sigma-70 factor, ECF subfamily